MEPMAALGTHWPYRGPCSNVQDEDQLSARYRGRCDGPRARAFGVPRRHRAIGFVAHGCDDSGPVESVVHVVTDGQHQARWVRRKSCSAGGERPEQRSCLRESAAASSAPMRAEPTLSRPSESGPGSGKHDDLERSIQAELPERIAHRRQDGDQREWPRRSRQHLFGWRLLRAERAECDLVVEPSQQFPGFVALHPARSYLLDQRGCAKGPRRLQMADHLSAGKGRRHQ